MRKVWLGNHAALTALLLLAGCAAAPKIEQRAAMLTGSVLVVTGPDFPPRINGDCNCDGAVNFDDIDGFVAFLAGGYADWATETGGACPWFNADCNYDGCVDFDDIGPFVRLLAQGT